MPSVRSLLLLAALLPSCFALGAVPARAQDEFGDLPPGPGQEETYYACVACHSIRLVTQQGLSREAWEETLVWMVEEQEMDPLEPDERELILNYLADHITPEWHKQRLENR